MSSRLGKEGKEVVISICRFCYIIVRVEDDLPLLSMRYGYIGAVGLRGTCVCAQKSFQKQWHKYEISRKQ